MNTTVQTTSIDDVHRQHAGRLVSDWHRRHRRRRLALIGGTTLVAQDRRCKERARRR